MKARDFSPLARRKSSLGAARFLAVLIFLGAGVAALGGLLDRDSRFGPELPGQAGNAHNLWGQTIPLDGQGLYRRDSLSAAIQERAQDLVTLVFALPLLGLALVASRKRKPGLEASSGRGPGLFPLLLRDDGPWALPTTSFFLLYVGLLALSLPAFCLALASVDLEALASLAEGRYPRRAVASLCLLCGGLPGPQLARGHSPALPALGPGA